MSKIGQRILRFFAPTKMADENFKRGWARFERLGASPSAVVALMRMNNEIDVRHVAAAIRVPTLVLHRSDDTRVNVQAGRYLGANIPGAKYVELPGSDHVLWGGDAGRIVDEIEEFLTGSRHYVEPDRILATLMFTDIVESTKRASEVGDRRWRVLMEEHDQLVRQELRALEDKRSGRPATVSWLPSTVLLAQSAVQPASLIWSDRWTFR